MPAPREPHPLPRTDQTQHVSASGDSDETAASPRDRSAASAAPAFGPPLAPGEVGRLGPYRIVKLPGHGGMGAVYAALDTRLDRRLALKVMLPEFAADPAARERFLREARAAARITHDNVVTVYEADERDGVAYIAMQFLQGYPLDAFLRRKGNPSIPQVLRIARETAAGLAAAHKIGLVHRDIKPANLWLEAPEGRVKVLDFGLARPVDAEVELTRSGAVVGTPAFMSPEQARGEKVDHRTDLFSLGVVLYRLCTGRLPFHGSTTMAVLMALGTEEPPPVRELNPEVPEPLAELIHQLLAKNPESRPASTEEVISRVRAADEETAVPMAEPAEGSPPQVVYLPIQVTAQPSEENPFADIDATESGQSMKVPPDPKPVRQKPRGRGVWVAAGLAVLAAVVLAGVIIIIKNKDGTETKIEVPDGATVTVKDKGGKTLAEVKPGEKPAADNSPDRKAAEWVLSLGGTVMVNGENREIWTVADLPKDRFTLTRVNLTGNKQVRDADLARLKELKGLTVLYLNSTGVTDAGLAHLKNLTGLQHIHLESTQVTDAGLAVFKDCKNLTHLNLGDTRTSDVGLAVFKDCKNLLSLSLYDTRVTDAGLANFKDCRSLLELHLGKTRVTDGGLAHFRECKNLARLDLSNTPVTDAGLANFKDCKKLVYLRLDSTRVGDAGLANFKESSNSLAWLLLANTQVSDALLANLKDAKNLVNLGVRGTNVTAKGLADFHAALPRCQIEHDGGVIEPKK